MAARIGGLALFGLLAVGMVIGSRALSSPQAMFDVVASDDKVMHAAIVGVFALAALVAVNSGSLLLRVIGGFVLMGCMSFGVMLWSSWNAPPELAEAFEMMDNIDDQFAQVAAALDGVDTNSLAREGGPTPLAAQPVIDRLVASGHVLVGRQCDLNAFGTGRERLAYLSEDSELVRLTVEVVRSDRRSIVDQSTVNGAAPLLPIEPACV